ncbi:hypothetical protein ACQEVY_23405 [Streptomyces sp. CA-288835]
MSDTETTKGIPVPRSSGGAPRMRANEGWPARDARPAQPGDQDED